MARFVKIVSVGATRGLCGPKPRRRFCRFMVTIAVTVVLVTASLSQAQRRRSISRALEPTPPRPQETTYPWPWLLGFVLLGLAWYPAFKNSKRELEP